MSIQKDTHKTFPSGGYLCESRRSLSFEQTRGFGKVVPGQGVPRKEVKQIVVIRV